jgi:hypothetical protein
MKLYANITTTIYVSGKDNLECGTRNSPCRLQNNELCTLFMKKLKGSINHHGYIRCKYCQNEFGQ